MLPPTDTYQTRPLTKQSLPARSETLLHAFQPPVPTTPLSPSKDTGLKSHARKRDPGHIKRPRNAFIIFRSHYLATENSRIPSTVESNHANLSRIAGEVWRNLPDEERAIWFRRANEEKEAHAKLYPGYRYSPSEFGDRPKKRVVKKDRDERHIREEEERCKNVALLLTRGHEGKALEHALSEGCRIGDARLDCEDDEDGEYGGPNRRRRIRARRAMTVKGQRSDTPLLNPSTETESVPSYHSGDEAVSKSLGFYKSQTPPIILPPPKLPSFNSSVSPLSFFVAY